MYAPVRSAALRHIADAIRDIARQRREPIAAHVAAPVQPPLGAASLQLNPTVVMAAVTGPNIAPAGAATHSDEAAAGTGTAQPDLGA